MVSDFIKKLFAPSNQSAQSDRQEFLIQVTMVLFMLMVGHFLMRSLNSKSKGSNSFRDAKGCPKDDGFKVQIWNAYAMQNFLVMQHLLPGLKPINHTEEFFKVLGEGLEKNFLDSTNQIIQFGISYGAYVTGVGKRNNRSVIGYDYAPDAGKIAVQNGAKMRLQNLNAIKDKELPYKTQLEEDFAAGPSDVFLIRVLEYLNPETVPLLMLSIICLAKLGSRFYIEISSPPADVVTNGVTIVYSLKPGTVRTFFNGNNGFEITELKSSNHHEEKGNTLERLLIEKRP